MPPSKLSAVRRVAEAQGWSNAEIDALERFRDHLVARVVTESQPDGST